MSDVGDGVMLIDIRETSDDDRDACIARIVVQPAVEELVRRLPEDLRVHAATAVLRRVAAQLVQLCVALRFSAYEPVSPESQSLPPKSVRPIAPLRRSSRRLCEPRHRRRKRYRVGMS